FLGFLFFCTVISGLVMANCFGRDLTFATLKSGIFTSAFSAICSILADEKTSMDSNKGMLKAYFNKAALDDSSCRSIFIRLFNSEPLKKLLLNHRALCAKRMVQ